MKKILIFLVFLIPLVLTAQPMQSSNNSTSTALLGNTTFTGTWERITNDYSWAIITIKSNRSSTANGLKIQQSKDGVNVHTAMTYTYTANDTTTNRFWIPITEGYMRVIYVNGTLAQTSFSLITTYQKGAVLPTDASGNIIVTSSGGATAANQVITNNNLDSLLNGEPKRTVQFISSTLKDLDERTIATTGGGYNKVTSTGGDSLLTTETNWWRVTIRAVDDTVAYSKSRTYPATDLNILYPGQSYTFEKLDAILVPKIYFKAYLSGTPTVQIKHEGR